MSIETCHTVSLKDLTLYIIVCNDGLKIKLLETWFKKGVDDDSKILLNLKEPYLDLLQTLSVHVGES